jgi:cytochrome d ubiquinol oxidase subunit II
MFPTLVRATDPALSLTVYNAASSPATLSTMLVIALIGIPFAPGRTIGICWVFRGKVRLDSMSY